MILHEPYGIDDPYKTADCERYPRDPRPGDLVQVRFKTAPSVEQAWADVITGGNCRRVEAQALGDGYWTAELGSFGPGVVEYEFGVGSPDEAAAETHRYRFEVGTWVKVSGVSGVEALPGRLCLTLETAAAPAPKTSGTPALDTAASPTEAAAAAYLDLSFPLDSVVRADLYTHGDEAGGAAAVAASAAEGQGTLISSTPYRHEQQGDTLTVTAPGIEVRLDLADLQLVARNPGADEPAFTGSLEFDWLAQADGQASLVRSHFTTHANEWLYGLGERFGDANRNGQQWDVRVYEEYKEQGERTYLPVPFVVSNRGYGLWIDADEPSYFDLRDPSAVVSVDKFVERVAGSAAAPDLATASSGATAYFGATAPATVPATTPLLSACILVGQEPYDITAAFTKLTGDIAVPPKWAFAPWMSSNSWNSQASAEAAIRRSVAEDVPAGVIVIEAWSDESTFYIFNDAEYDPKPSGEPLRLADFTFAGRWPDPQAFIDYCHEHGTRVVLWQIPVLKHLIEPHPQHDNDEWHMVERGYAILNADGSPYRNKGWWFSGGLVIDFTNPEAREWWFAKRQYLFDELGIDGMKTDGGEHLWGRDLRAHDGRRGVELYNAYANEYVGAYHDFVRAATGDDGVTFSRAGYTGAQRFPGHWAGDEDSSWDAYRASIRAGLAAGVSGVSMWSWDIAGFSGEIPPVELYLRSTAMAVFSPLMQYHSEGHGASESRDRTPWNVAERHGDNSALEQYRRFAHLRMRLLDLIHQDATVLSEQGLPLMRYPALAYPAEHEFLSQDPYAYLFGRDLLVAPVVDKGVGSRTVRLPPGSWVDAWSGAELTGPRVVQATATIERIPVFVRAESPRLRSWLGAFSAGGGRG